METVEIVIYLSVAIVIGFLTLSVIVGWDYSGFVNALSGTQKSRPSFESVDKEQFVGKAAVFWKSCGLGAVERTLSLHVNSVAPDTIDREFFFDEVIRLNMCSSLQRTDPPPAIPCGTSGIDNVDFPVPIALPAVIRLRCEPSTQVLEIRG